MKKTRLQSEVGQKESAAYLLKYFLLANFLQYLEAGAVPALLVSLSRDFDMDHGQQGILGGAVYLALSIGGPFAAYFLKYYNHRRVIGIAVIFNTLCTLLWALTPVQYSFSTILFIALRFVMGLGQCFLCVFLPLWINDFSPSYKRTQWTGYLQVNCASCILPFFTTYTNSLLRTDVIGFRAARCNGRLHSRLRNHRFLSPWGHRISSMFPSIVLALAFPSRSILTCSSVHWVSIRSQRAYNPKSTVRAV